MVRVLNGEIHLDEAPELRWFERLPKCKCGKTATGILRGTRNESYGHHCDKCADKRLKASAKERDALAKLNVS
jgi:hypothetical protein